MADKRIQVGNYTLTIQVPEFPSNPSANEITSVIYEYLVGDIRGPRGKCSMGDIPINDAVVIYNKVVKVLKDAFTQE